MSWGYVAVGAGMVVSSGISYLSSKESSKKSKEARKTELGFAQEQYDDWKEVYGPLEENLANYYANVTPDYYASIGLEEFETQYQTSLDRLDENLAQRGIDPSSGIAVSLESQAELDAAETRAGIRREAPRKAAEDKSKFLQIGLGQSPSTTISNTLARQSDQAARESATSSAATGQAISATIPVVAKGISAYANRTVTPATVAPQTTTT